MSAVTFPKVRVGEPVRHESLALYPLYGESTSQVEYRLSEEALADESLLVEEVNDSGSVPELFVENKGDTQVLFLEGEELIGAKQNRVLNTSVLIGAQTRIKIPVSCVEQGRWGYNSRQFQSSGSHSPSKMRHRLKASVTQSLRESGEHRSDQGEVWSEVQELQCSHKVASPTMAMSDTFGACEMSITDYREKLPYVEGATGVAIVVGDRLVSVDMFDKPQTCEKVWKRLISGTILEALVAQSSENQACMEDVQRLLESTPAMKWESAKPVGQGEEHRAEGEQGVQASALFYDQTMVHGSVLAAPIA